MIDHEQSFSISISVSLKFYQLTIVQPISGIIVPLMIKE